MVLLSLSRDNGPVRATGNRDAISRNPMFDKEVLRITLKATQQRETHPEHSPLGNWGKNVSIFIQFFSLIGVVAF